MLLCLLCLLCLFCLLCVLCVFADWMSFVYYIDIFLLRKARVFMLIFVLGRAYCATTELLTTLHALCSLLTPH